VADYGTATILVVDGKPTVTQADDVIGVTVDLLAECERWCFGPDGLFWLDAGGEYRYRPVRFATDAPGVLVCERVRFATGGVVYGGRAVLIGDMGPEHG
jgi:hypothetical protein